MKEKCLIFMTMVLHAIHYSFLSRQAICTEKHPVHYTHMSPITPAVLTNSSGIFLSAPWAEFRFDCHSQPRMALLEYKPDFSTLELVGSSYSDEPLPVSGWSTASSLHWFVKYNTVLRRNVSSITGGIQRQDCFFIIHWKLNLNVQYV